VRTAHQTGATLKDACGGQLVAERRNPQGPH
jgi:hypothetical protein